MHIVSKLSIYANVGLLTGRLHLCTVNVGQGHQMSGSPRLSSVLRACYRPYSLRSGAPRFWHKMIPDRSDPPCHQPEGFHSSVHRVYSRPLVLKSMNLVLRAAVDMSKCQRPPGENHKGWLSQRIEAHKGLACVERAFLLVGPGPGRAFGLRI